VTLNKTGRPQMHALQSLDALAVNIRCSRGQEICSPSRPADYWYRVVSGSARRCVIRPDGRRQIVDLLLPGDFFGFSERSEYDSTVEAVVEATIVASYPRKRAEMMADADPQLARELRQVAYKALARSRAHLLILGRITAREKVGAFRPCDGHHHAADLALRHRRLSGAVRRNGVPLSDGAQAARSDRALWHALC
jgi:CRP/FNR family transcriptional regulator, nitrogen fixation regulation protein